MTLFRLQAKGEDNQLYSWTSPKRDFSGDGFPGPGTPSEVRILARLDDDSTGRFDVRKFGARGQGYDDTAAIQSALDAAYDYGAGEVWLAPITGGYRASGKLTVRPYTMLVGSYRGMRRGLRVYEGFENSWGSLLVMDHADVGLDLKTGCTVDGLEFWYPNQVRLLTDNEPVVHDWLFDVLANEHHVTIRNISATFPYRLFRCAADGATIGDIKAFPLSVGIELRRCADVVTMGKMQFGGNVMALPDDSLPEWVRDNGQVMRFGGAEEFQMNSVVAYGYNRGITFFDLEGWSAGSYGSINGGGFDICRDGIVVEPHGLGSNALRLFGVGFIPNGGAAIKVADADQGVHVTDFPNIEVHGCNVWGPSERAIWIGEDSVSRVRVYGGNFHSCSQQAFLVQSPDAELTLVGVQTAECVRVHNPGNGKVIDSLGSGGGAPGHWGIHAQSFVAIPHTGTTDETILATIPMRPHLMGMNGMLRVTTLWSYPTSGNNKTLRTRFGAAGAGTGGTAYQAMVVSNSVTLMDQRIIANRGVADSQVGGTPLGTGGWGFNSTTRITSTVDTSADTELAITAQLANTGETITLEGYIVEIGYRQ